MILLIFTVSTGDQPATPAALPRCPWEAGQSCCSHTSSRAAPGPQVRPALCSHAVPVMKGDADSTRPRTVCIWGQVCGRGVCDCIWLSTQGVLTVVLGRYSSLPQCFSDKGLLRAQDLRVSGHS